MQTNANRTYKTSKKQKFDDGQSPTKNENDNDECVCVCVLSIGFVMIEKKTIEHTRTGIVSQKCCFSTATKLFNIIVNPF